MKRLTVTLFCIALLAWSLPGRAAMSTSEVRQNARFLSDRMAYELNLNPTQYADVYEINYDFLSGVRLVMDGVIRGNEYSIDRYYEYLDMRNEDLSYVLSRRQYLEFANKEYFYRPIYTDRNVWRLRVYTVYKNTTYFYFSLPVNFYTYNGIHSRSRYRGGYYTGRYHHERYHGPLYHIRDHKSYADHRWHDFKAPAPRPGKRPSRYEPVRPGHSDRPNLNNRPGNNGHSGIQNRPPQDHRPNGNGRPNTSVRPDNNRPNGHTNIRPDQGNRPNQGNRPGQGVRPEQNRPNQNNHSGRPNRPNSTTRPNQGGNRPNSGNKPDNNVRPNQNGNHSGQQTRPSGTSRPVQVVHQPNKDKGGNSSSERETKRYQSGGSRR